jgi:hypothetical protein
MGLRRRGRRFHNGVAVAAGAQRQAAEETIEHGRKLRLDVGQGKEILVEQVPAALAVPLQAVEFAGTAPALDHQADRVGGALRGVWHARGQQQNIAGPDRQIADVAILDHAQQHVALELIKKLLRRVDMKILACIGAADHHDEELAVLVDHLVADRRTQQMPIGVDPLVQIDGNECSHGDDVRRSKCREFRVW